jgi:hypothetical protein
MVIIWKLQRLTKKMRDERGLPPIADMNDLPDPQDQADYVSVSGQSDVKCKLIKHQVLTDKQQEQLRHQQEHFAKSQVSSA